MKMGATNVEKRSLKTKHLAPIFRAVVMSLCDTRKAMKMGATNVEKRSLKTKHLAPIFRAETEKLSHEDTERRANAAYRPHHYGTLRRPQPDADGDRGPRGGRVSRRAFRAARRTEDRHCVGARKQRRRRFGGGTPAAGAGDHPAPHIADGPEESERRCCRQPRAPDGVRRARGCRRFCRVAAREGWP